MKRVIAFVGSARKKHTHDAVVAFLNHLQSMGDVECEIVRLNDYRIEACRGCKVCFTRGEEYCPLKDDRDVLIGKLESADGIIWATPNYCYQVSALMKLFLDRLGFAMHRQRFFGRVSTSIVTQGFFRGEKIVDYLDFVGMCLGFNTVKGSVFTALEPMTTGERSKMAQLLEKHARRFYATLLKPAYPVPSLTMLIGFRMGRMAAKLDAEESNRDHQYYKEKGWFESDYFYPTRLGLLKKAAGRFFDCLAESRIRARHKLTHAQEAG